MNDRTRWLAAYDDQLRTDAETPSAISTSRLGPLRLVAFAGGRGFITYRDLGGADASAIHRLVPEALAHYRANPEITRVEWKTRGHDSAPGLHEALLEHGFVLEDPESIMIGEAQALAVDAPLPEGVALRQLTAADDVRAMSALQDGRVNSKWPHHDRLDLAPPGLLGGLSPRPRPPWRWAGVSSGMPARRRR